MTDEDRINTYNLNRATKRLIREIDMIFEDIIPGIDLRANEENILEWHFVIHGKENTPYYGGMYHGKLIFPSNFPFCPPKIIFLTPNGRFKTNERICFNLSDFHPEEWKPAFSVTTVLQGVRDFMHDSIETIGSIETSESEKRQLAESSSTFNRKDITFCHLFSQLCGRKEMDSENCSSERAREIVCTSKEIGVEASSPNLPSSTGILADEETIITSSFSMNDDTCALYPQEKDRNTLLDQKYRRNKKLIDYIIIFIISGISLFLLLLSPGIIFILARTNYT